MEFAPQARITSRGDHPDLDPESGDLYFDVYSTPDPKERDFDRQWRNDPDFRENYMQRAMNFQSRLPVGVQHFVQDRQYGSTPYQGIREYAQALETGITVEAGLVGANIILTDVQVANMTLEQYDRYFDQNGQPKAGVGLHVMRGKRLDSTRPS